MPKRRLWTDTEMQVFRDTAPPGASAEANAAIGIGVDIRNAEREEQERRYSLGLAAGRRQAGMANLTAMQSLQPSPEMRLARNDASRALRMSAPGVEFRAALTGAESYERAFRSYLAGSVSDSDRAVLRVGEHRDLTSLTGSSGGYTVPKTFYRQLTAALPLTSPIRALAQPIETTSGAELDLAFNDDTSNAALITTENSTVNSTTDPVFSLTRMYSWTFVSPAVIYPVALQQDSGIDLVPMLSEIAAGRLGRGIDPYLCTGTGASQPLGLFPGVTSALTSASPTGVTRNELANLFFSVKPAYRPNGTWVMHSNTYAAILELVGSDGLPVFDENSGRLFGRPVVCTDNAPSMAATHVPIVFGSISQAYAVRSVAPPIALALKERYMDILAGALIVAERVDGTVLNPAAARSITMHS